MAKRIYFPQLWAELTKPEPVLRPAYLLYGPEEYLSLKALSRISQLCGQVDPFDRVEFAGAETDVATVAEELTCAPMVADRRLVVVRQAERVLAKATAGGALTAAGKALLQILSSPLPACAVFVVSPSVDFRSLPGGPLLSAMFVCGSYPLSERDLLKWLEREAQERGLVMRRAALERLAAVAGPGLLDLEHELDKLAAFSQDQEITPQTVDQVVSPGIRSLQDFLDAVACRDFAAAVDCVEDVLLVPRYTARVIPALVSVCEELRAFLRGEIGSGEAALPRRKMEDLTAKASRWTLEELDEAMDALFRAELRTRTGVDHVESAIVQLLAELSSCGTRHGRGGMASQPQIQRSTADGSQLP